MIKLDERATFIGTFIRSSVKKNYKENTPVILFSPVTDEIGNIIFKKLWMNYNKGFKALGSLKYGDKVSFVAKYEIKKNRFGEAKDLTRPNNIKKVSEDELFNGQSKTSLYEQRVNALLKELEL